MKIIVKTLLVFLMFLSAFNAVYVFTDIESIKKAEATLSPYIAMEVSTCRVLTGENINSKAYMASTTKILTAITVIENCDITKEVTVTRETIGVEGSSMYLEEGEVLSVKDLLYGLMLRSGNDAAETLAVYCSKSVKAFAELMNKTADKIGAKNSNFVNPHGLHDDNHYTTAYDLALISCYALKNNDFREIVSTKKVTVPHTTGEYNRVLLNKNKMLFNYDGATGIKTGYTKKAGRCLVASAIRNGMEVVTVVLNCPPMWEKSENLLDYSFGNYSMVKLFEADNIVAFSEIVGEHEEKCGLEVKRDILLPLTDYEAENLDIIYDYKKTIKPPFKKGEIAGEIKIYASKNLIFSEKIYTIICRD